MYKEQRNMKNEKAYDMFKKCESLKSIDSMEGVKSNGGYMNGMFKDCINVNSIKNMNSLLSSLPSTLKTFENDMSNALKLDCKGATLTDVSNTDMEKI